MHVRPLVTAALALSAVATALLVPAGSAGADPGRHDRADVRGTVAQVRQAIAPYRDVDAAVAAGYVPVSPCETSPDGGMGIHYLNPALVGSTDPFAPAVLLYEATADGGMTLLGAEWFAVDADQDLGGRQDGRKAVHGSGRIMHRRAFTSPERPDAFRRRHHK